MTIATRPRAVLPKPKQSAARTVRRLTETVHGVGPLPAGSPRVDREKGVIFSVRVCGTESDNSRVYLPEALKKAIPLYEGVKVRLNHPKRPLDERDISDTLGWLENVRQGDDGALYADLHFLRSHPYAEALCEAAERNPALVGLSHNADGRGYEDDRGRFVIQEIQTLRSVDVVDQPATSESIFESKGTPVPTTLRALIEASPRKQLFAKHLLEMPEDMADMPVDAPVDAAPPEGDWKSDLVAAIGKLVSSEDEADHKLAQKIMGMLKPGAVAPAETTTEAEGEEGEEEEGEEEEKPKMESRKSAPAPGAVTLTEAKAKRLVKGYRLKESPALIKQLTRLPDDDAALELLEYLQEIGTPAKGTQIRSQGPGSGTPDQPPAKFPTTPDERRKLLAS